MQMRNKNNMLADLQQLLTDLAYTSALICTVGRDVAISELFLDGSPKRVDFADSWATVEFSGWHIHVDLSTVTTIRFAEAQSHGDSTSLFISFDDVEQKAVMRFYFPHASHTHRTYTAEELELFGKFREQYEGVGGQGPGKDQHKQIRCGISKSLMDMNPVHASTSSARTGSVLALYRSS